MKYRLHRLIKQIALIIFLVISHWSLAIGHCAQPNQYIRVNILPETASFILRIDGPYEIQDGIDRRVLSQGPSLKTTVALHKNNIFLGGIDFTQNKLLVKAKEGSIVAVGGRRFRGDIMVIKKDSRNLAAINYIDLEDYIKGILYHEASHYWPPEALKAQAVAARTFAVFQAGVNSSRDFDVTSDIYSQVYGGHTSERMRTNKAVEETRSLLLAFEEKVFPAYYHATCGGSTEDASLLWSINMPPLKGLPCPFCKNSPHYNWHYVLSKKEIKEALNKSGYNSFKEIKGILISGRDPSGRITDLKISTDKKTLKIPAKDFRNIIGPNIIRSTNFEVNIAGNDAVFTGIGWGHGAGLCQWGAYFMAKEGYNYQEILKYYYPQADVKTIGF